MFQWNIANILHPGTNPRNRRSGSPWPVVWSFPNSGKGKALDFLAAAASEGMTFYDASLARTALEFSFWAFYFKLPKASKLTKIKIGANQYGKEKEP